ncbi:hypothetical protein [uncultured Tateyamaria sp.]|uniref:hypothetical protein n=1 Tax=uncultured Tateyamaria sp. TaxID=455651 RepID=UPI00262417A4|nr:hypothetical protein [uncultured Tateyamaria sp.]
MRLFDLQCGLFALSLATCLAPLAALAQTPMLGQAYPSGAIYLMAPDADQTSWPDTLTLVPLSEGATSTPAHLDRIARGVHPAAAENAPSESGRCGRAGEPITTSGLDVFDRGMPDNCDVPDHLGLYRAGSGIAAGAVLGWTGAIAGPVDLAQAGKPRDMSPAEVAEVATYREDFRAAYRDAFDTPYDPDQSPIGAIPTLDDARILAHVPIEGGQLRLSEWERITIAQHIYRHFVVDVMRSGEVVETFQFIRFQGVLG